MQSVGNDRVDAHPGLDHDGHLVPGLVHFASVDPLEGDHIKDDLSPVDIDIFGKDSEEGDFPAVAHTIDHLPEGFGAAGHFQANVEALLHAKIIDDGLKGLFGWVDGNGGPQLTGEFEAVRIDIGNDDMARTGMLDDGGGHASDGAGAGDEDILAEDIEAEGGMGGIAEGVEAGEDLEGDSVVGMPDVGDGDGNVFGEGTVAIDANSDGGAAEVATSGAAITALAADNMAFAGNNFAFFDILNVAAKINDLSDEFMPDDHGRLDGALGPLIPLVDVDISSANRGFQDPDENVVGSHCGFGPVDEGETGAGYGFRYGFQIVRSDFLGLDELLKALDGFLPSVGFFGIKGSRLEGAVNKLAAAGKVRHLIGGDHLEEEVPH